MGTFNRNCKWTPVYNKKGEWDGRTITIEESFKYTSNDGVSISVPAGFISDGLSVPRLLWSIKRPLGKGLRAGIIHDYAYGTRMLSRKQADKIFLEALKDCNVNIVTRSLMWASVRGFGWRYYLLIALCLLMTGCSTIMLGAVKAVNYTISGIKAVKFVKDAVQEKKEKEEVINDDNIDRQL